MTDNALLQAALEYARRGWPVLPLTAGEKAPNGGLVHHGHKEATTDSDKIKVWWTEHPESNIGVCVGFEADLIVIDVDMHDVDGKASLKSLEEDTGELPETYTNETAGGGSHYFFKFPEELKEAELKAQLAPGIDLKHKGFVVMPPSVVNGNPYQSIADGEIAGLPSQWVELCKKHEPTYEEWTQIRRHANPAGLSFCEQHGLSMSDVLQRPANAKKTGDGYLCEHLIHGATGSGNLYVNLRRNLWCCFRHGTGGDVLTWKAVEMGLIDCEQAGRLDSDTFKAVIRALKDEGVVEDLSAPVDVRFTEIESENSEPDLLTTDGLLCLDPDNPCLSADAVKEHTLKRIDTLREKETDVPIVTGYKMTGSGNALRLIAYFGDGIRYSNQLKCWFIYDGTCWVRDEQLKIMELAKQTADRIHAEVAFLERDNPKEERKAREELAKWALKSESRYNLEEMVSLAKSDVRVRISPEELDARDELINFPNGTLDLEKREFREHRREDMLSKMTKVPYDPTHSSEYFYSTLLDALPADVVVYLQRVLGSCLEYTTQNKEILILYGAPYAGKSSITQAVYNALGDYAAPFPKELLQKSKQGIAANAARPELMALEGVRIAWTEETNEDMIFDESIFRSLTSSGIKSARNLFERQRKIHLGASFIIETNAPPTVDVTDQNSRNAMLDRILVCPFLNTIPKEKRDKEVLRRLTNDEDELTVAIAWLVQGYFDRKDHGLQIPDSVTQGKEEYEVQVNPLFEFVNNEVVFDDGRKNGEIHHEVRTLTADLLQRLLDTEGKVVANSRQFNKHFKNLLPYFENKTGIKAELKHLRDGAAWLNVRLRDEADEVLSEEGGQSTSGVCDDVTENTSFGESNLSNLVDYYRYLHQNPKLRHIITPSFVSILIESIDAPELDFEASEGKIENEPQCDDNVTETETTPTLTKGKCQPSQAQLGEVIHDILIQFNKAVSVQETRFEYSNLRGAVCARIKRDHPEWSEYDLEAAYDHFYEVDSEINAMIVSVCGPSSKVQSEKDSPVRG
jgi:putative DNA primase/helicase